MAHVADFSDSGSGYFKKLQPQVARYGKVLRFNAQSKPETLFYVAEAETWLDKTENIKYSRNTKINTVHFYNIFFEKIYNYN